MMIVLDADAETSPDHGVSPSERSIDQLFESGFILLDKAPGPSSHQVSAWARDMMGLEKLGHGGTLDPFAEGILIIVTGKETANSNKYMSETKTYKAVISLGQQTDTLDNTCLLYTSPSPRDS